MDTRLGEKIVLTPETIKIAKKEFKKRYARHKGKQIDNSSLYAGSPMYFYCRGCGVQTDCLPESYLSTPKKICNECKPLEELGILTRLREEIK